MIKVVAIDVDDTLCLTEAACFALENDVLAAMGRSPMSREVHVATWGQPLFQAIMTRSVGIDVEAFRAAYQPLIAQYIAAGKLDDIPGDNYRALDLLIAKGKRIVLLTSRTEGEMRHMLAPDHELAARVSAIYHKDNTAYHKPDPRVFDELLRDFKVETHQIVYVGDSPSDAEAANGRGIYFIADLESGLRQPADFAGYRVASSIMNFPKIVEAVAALDPIE